MSLHIIDHPLVQHKLSIMRNKETSTAKFRQLLQEISQQELADAAELSHGYIREIESPKMCTTFSLDAVEKIANGLDIEFKYLFDEPSDKDQE